MNELMYEIFQDVKNVLIVDTETTDLSKQRQVIELGVTNLSGYILFEQRFRVDREIDKETQKIHGITNESLKECKEPEYYTNEIKELFKGKILISYNADFDIESLYNTFNGIFDDVETYYCLMVAYTYFKGIKHFKKLKHACEDYNVDISDLQKHRAIDDCQKVARLIHAIVERHPNIKLKPIDNSSIKKFHGIVKSVFLKLSEDELAIYHPVLYCDDYGTYLTKKIGGIVRVEYYSYNTHAIVARDIDNSMINIHLDENTNRQLAITFIQCHEKDYYRDLFIFNDDNPVLTKSMADRAGSVFSIMMYDFSNDTHVEKKACYIYAKGLSVFPKKYTSDLCLDFDSIDTFITQRDAYSLISYSIFQNYIQANINEYPQYNYVCDSIQYKDLYDIDSNNFCLEIKEAREQYRKNIRGQYADEIQMQHFNNQLYIAILEAMISLHRKKFGDRNFSKTDGDVEKGKYIDRGKPLLMKEPFVSIGELQTSTW